MIYLLSPVQREGTVFLPMIGFTTVAETIDFSGIDTLMFTSKQAVKVADQIDQKWKEYPSIAIGNATKKQIEDLGGEVIYQPQHFYGEVLSQDIAMFFRERKILYLRPNEVSFDAKTFLAKQGIRLFEQIIYETTCVKYDKEDMPQKDAVIIFTSPSTIHCFFRNFSWDPSYTAVVIGEATKVHLPKGARYAVAKEPLIASCIEKAEEILLSSNSK
ncbi:uroporphyrinogen-III synthase [Sulfurovum sp. ST-21]|nr:uroporphyrinogen-III synthase [Sulfurovum indicum]